jgi:hypothetical protein
MRLTTASKVGISAAAAVFALGCGASTSPADAFVGTWTFDSGVINMDCTYGVGPQIQLIGSTMTIAKIDATDVAATFAVAAASCDVDFTVSGRTATVQAGQTCAISDGVISGTVEINSGSLFFSSGHLVLGLLGDFSISQYSGTYFPVCTPGVSGTFPVP